MSNFCLGIKIFKIPCSILSNSALYVNYKPSTGGKDIPVRALMVSIAVHVIAFVIACSVCTVDVSHSGFNKPPVYHV